MIKRLILGVLALVVIVIVALVAVIAMQPPEYVVTRSATVNAPQTVVFENVNDFHKWDAWSPWAKLDPAMKVTHAGPPAGVGSSYSWEGNSEAGKGVMSIIDSRPSEMVKININVIEPISGTAVTEFNMTPAGNGTNVTWKMTGQKNFMSKAFGLIVDMDKMIGADFEKGLAQMKTALENSPELSTGKSD
jgi:carbon monoxide dehydrogenase subunit G